MFALVDSTARLCCQCFESDPNEQGAADMIALDACLPALATWQTRHWFAFTVHWLNFQGERVFYQTLAPGRGYSQQTYYQHVWAVTDLNGNCIQTARAGAGPITVYIN